MKLLGTALRVCVLSLVATASNAAQKVLYVYNWSEYMPEAVLSAVVFLIGAIIGATTGGATFGVTDSKA